MWFNCAMTLGYPINMITNHVKVYHLAFIPSAKIARLWKDKGWGPSNRLLRDGTITVYDLGIKSQRLSFFQSILAFFTNPNPFFDSKDS